ncbi:MAG: hypothetical protein P4L49_21030 [Desulfosporosinus sp.]|nr:hypothetical protein [Desulfosporosinus sp.]
MTDNFTDIEEALERLCVPDDIMEFAQTNSSEPTEESIERIRHRTLQLAQTGLKKPKQSRIKLWQAITVSVAAILLLVLGSGPNNIAEALNRLLFYIPGFGIHSTENVSLVVPNPVRVEKDGVKIDINGVLADDKGTSVMAYVESAIPDMNTSYLEDMTGKRYSYQSGNMCTAGNFGNYWAWYKPLPSNVNQVTLVIPSLSNWAINIPLSNTANLNPVEKFGPSVTVNNVTVAGQATKFSDETKVTFLVQSLRGGILQMIENPVLTGSDGKPYQLNCQPSGFMGSGLSYFSTSLNVGDKLTVNMPSLILQQDVHGSIVIPTPENNSALTLNQSLNLGSWTLKLTKSEIISDNNGISLRIYVEPDIHNGATINTLDQLTIDGRMVSWSSKFNQNTGGMEWLQVPYPTGGKDMKITVEKINILVNGPWKIEIPVIPGF